MKKMLRIVLIILSLIIIFAASLAVYVKTALPNVGKAADIKIEPTAGRIARGKYLANNVTACVVCHSGRDWTTYAGPIKEGTVGMGGERFGPEEGFPGTLYSKNITPYGLHDWTDGEIVRAITEGVSKNGTALFPLMQYPSYAKMSREDIYSIIAYVRTLPPVKNDPPAHSLDFPLNFIVNTIPAKADLLNQPDTGNAVEYGKYLAEVASCIECHSKIHKGKRILGTEFGGGRPFPFPNGTIAFSANITPDKNTGIGNWTKELFIRKFKQYKDSTYIPAPVSEKDFNTIMPWTAFAGMTEKDLSAIYAYLTTIKPIENKVDRFVKGK